MNRPTAGKNRSAGSNARVVCSTLLCAMPIRQGFPPCQSAPGASALSAHRLRTRPPLLYMRAWNQRIRESARLLRVMCSHAWYRESHGERPTLSFCFAHLPHSLATQYSLRLSRVCGRSSKEESLPLFVLFVLFGQAKSTPYLLVLFGQAKSTWCLLLLFGQAKSTLTYCYFM